MQSKNSTISLSVLVGISTLFVVVQIFGNNPTVSAIIWCCFWCASILCDLDLGRGFLKTKGQLVRLILAALVTPTFFISKTLNPELAVSILVWMLKISLIVSLFISDDV